MINQDKEIEFRKVTYPGVDSNRYLISEDGAALYDTLHKRYVKSSIDNGYLRCTLNKIHCPIHRLVAYEFCPKNRDLRLQIDHVDGNKMNNHYTNLEWVTPAENTRRAHASGLYNTRGENSTTNKYQESLIHDICRMFVSGMTNMEIFRKITNHHNVDITNPDDKSMYHLIFRLRKKRVWPDVVCLYEYDTYLKSKISIYPNENNSRYTEDQIRKICELKKEGKSIDQIIEIIGLRDMAKDENDFNKYRAVLYNILNGNIWRNISKEYLDDYNKKHHTVYNINASLLNRLLEFNSDKKYIYQMMGIKFDGTKNDKLLKRAVDRRIKNYMSMSVLKDSESINLYPNDLDKL